MPILPREPVIFPNNLLDNGAAEPFDRRWWVVYTKARQEKALARQLVSYQVPFYLPLVSKENFIRDRRHESFIPLFSGYVFLFGTASERVSCLTTSRVSRMLAVTDQERLRDDLRNVRRLIIAEAPLTVESRLIPGQRVRIKAGCLKGVEGTVVARHGTKKKRVIVAISMLQQGVSVEIDDFMLEPLDWIRQGH